VWKKRGKRSSDREEQIREEKRGWMKDVGGTREGDVRRKDGGDGEEGRKDGGGNKGERYGEGRKNGWG
jgi:hypothetical protein